MSPHKNLGGAEATGALIVKNSAYDLGSSPSFPGGGTIKYVFGLEKRAVSYLDDPASRETAGTPNAIGFYRAALSFEL
jgi:selenocysteine lyase/cysteine desulfurase